MPIKLKKVDFEAFRTFLETKGFRFENRPNQEYLAKGSFLNVSLYETGSVVIQGSNHPLRQDIEEYLADAGAEKKEKKKKEYAAIDVPFPHVGIDEAGKGDYFGPLVIAAVLVTEDSAKWLLETGVQDSKKLSDRQIPKLAWKIRQLIPEEQRSVVAIGPEKYNELYSSFENLNTLLGWGHARALENILSGLTSDIDCKTAIADKFGNERSIRSQLGCHGKKIDLIQVPKGERDIAVAAASILARERFLYSIRDMGEPYGKEFPKGATHVIPFAKQFVEKHGEDELRKVAKLHFATTKKVNNCG